MMARFEVRDVRQPFLFEWNIGELLELRARQAVFFYAGPSPLVHSFFKHDFFTRIKR
jgi:hypothetical protein